MLHTVAAILFLLVSCFSACASPLADMVPRPAPTFEIGGFTLPGVACFYAPDVPDGVMICQYEDAERCLLVTITGDKDPPVGPCRVYLVDLLEPEPQGLSL